MVLGSIVGSDSYYICPPRIAYKVPGIRVIFSISQLRFFLFHFFFFISGCGSGGGTTNKGQQHQRQHIK